MGCSLVLHFHPINSSYIVNTSYHHLLISSTRYWWKLINTWLRDVDWKIKISHSLKNNSASLFLTCGKRVPLVVIVFLVPRAEIYVLVWVLGYFIKASWYLGSLNRFSNCHFLGYKQKISAMSFLEIRHREEKVWLLCLEEGIKPAKSLRQSISLYWDQLVCLENDDLLSS